MNYDTQMLQGICQSTQLGQNGIRAVIKKVRDPALQQVLSSQLGEYAAIHRQAQRLLKDRGQRAKRIPGVLLAFSRMEAGRNLAGGSSGSSIAERMIEQNKSLTRSILQNCGKHPLDPKVSTLSNRLLQTAQENIAQMSPFLS